MPQANQTSAREGSQFSSTETDPAASRGRILAQQVGETPLAGALPGECCVLGSGNCGAPGMN